MKKTLAILYMILAVQEPLVHAEPANADPLAGLWRYDEISHGGEAPLTNTGLFLFHNGRFFQQTIDDDMGQAHAGTYTIDDGTVSFNIEMGILVSENYAPVMAVRLNANNRASIDLQDNLLTLKFDEKTVQTLKKHSEVENAEVYTVQGGYLVFTHDSFIYMSLESDNLEAGSGRYKQIGDTFTLQANPWISVSGERVIYSYNEEIDLNLREKTFDFSSGRTVKLNISSEIDE